MATTKVGQRVTIKGKEEEYGEGTVKFVGIVKFDTGKWVGIELDKPLGKHDGVVKGERYFQTKPNHAVFTKYGQTTPAGIVAPTPGVKKAPVAASSSSAAAKKAPTKIPSGRPEISSKSTAGVASPSKSSLESVSSPTSPPNEPEEFIDDITEASTDVTSNMHESHSSSSLLSDSAVPFSSPLASELSPPGIASSSHTPDAIYSPIASPPPTLSSNESHQTSSIVPSVPVVSEQEHFHVTTELKQQLETLEQRLNTTNAEKVTLSLKVSELEEAAKSSAATTSLADQDHQRVASELKQQLSALEQRLLAADTEKEALNRSIKILEATVNSSSSESSSSDQEHLRITSELNQQLNTLEQRLLTVSNEKETLCRKVEVLGTNLDEASKKHVESEQSIKAELNQQVNTLEQRLLTAATEKDALQRKVESLEASLDEANKKHVESEQSIKAVEHKLVESGQIQNDLNQKMKALVLRLEEEEKKKAEADQSISELVAKLDDADQDYVVLKDSNDELTATNEQLKASIERLESSISILKEGSASIIAQHQAGGAEKEAVEADLRSQLRELSRKLEASIDKNSDFEKKVRDLEHQLAANVKSSAEYVTTAVQKAVADKEAELAKLKTETEDRIETLSADLEMAAMDREIAEEERDAAVKELEQLKLQVEVLEAFKQSAEQAKSSVLSTPSIASGSESSSQGVGSDHMTGTFDVTKSPEYQTLFGQHERLQAVLVKLKDMAVLEQQEHEKASRELENVKLRVIPGLEEKVLKLSEQNVEYEEQIELLKANIDDSAELQAKFSDLFEQKLDLEEEHKKMKSALAELEALRDLSEELEEAQTAAESRLKAELYQKQVEVLDREASIKNANEQIAQQQVLIARIQSMLDDQRNATLAAEKKASTALSKLTARSGSRRFDEDFEDGLDHLSTGDLDGEDDLADETGESGRAGSSIDGRADGGSSSTMSLRSIQASKESELQIILQKQASKAAIQTLVNKLTDLDRQQAIEQFGLYQSFVPESYIRVDADSIRCLLLSKRLVEKVSIVVSHLHEQFHLERFERSAVVTEDPSSFSPLTTTEELSAFSWNLAALLNRIGNNAAVLAESLKVADAESYVRFSRLLSELAPVEKKVDHLITLLQQEELTAAYSLQDFETLLESAIEPLVFQHCLLTSLPAHQHYMRLGSELVYASRACFFEVVALKTTLSQLAATLQLDVTSLLSTVDLISLTIVKYLVDGSRKLRRAAEGRPALSYTGNTLAQLYAAAKLVRTLQSLFAGIRTRVVQAGERLDSTVLNEFKEALVSHFTPTIDAASSSLPAQDATAGRLTKPYDANVTCVLKLLFSLDEDIGRGAHDISASESRSSTRTVDGVVISNVVTLQARAAILLEEVATAAGLKGELATTQKDLREREASLSTKNKEIEDLEWKAKKLEHRLLSLEKVEAEAKEELTTHQKNYASQVMNLESSNRDLLEQVEQLKVETQEAKLSAATHSTRAASLEEQLAATLHKQQHSISLDSATTQISSLKAAVRHLRHQINRLKTAEARSVLSNKLPPLSIGIPAQLRPVPGGKLAGTSTSDSAAAEEESAASTVGSPRPVDVSPSAPKSSLSEEELSLERRAEAARTIGLQAARLLDSAYTITTAPAVIDLTVTNNTPQQQLEARQFEELRIKAALLKTSKVTVKALADTTRSSAPSNFSNFPSTSFVSQINTAANGPVTVGRLTLPAPLQLNSSIARLRSALPTPISVTPADLCSIHELFVK